MLISRPTKKAAGIEIFGDFKDIESLHETVHFLCDSSILVPQMEDYVLGLAYEIRHCYQGDRLKEYFGEKGVDGAEYFGFRYLWPQFLVQLSLLRNVANSIKTNHEHQSNIFRLEHIALEALVKLDPKMASNIFALLPNLAELNHKNYLFQFIDYQTWEYVTDLKTKHDRLFDLEDLMNELLPSSEDYRDFRLGLVEEAKKKGCSPLEIDYAYEWPEFKW